MKFLRVFIVALTILLNLHANDDTIKVFTDTEIEDFIKEMAVTIYKTANLNPDKIRVVFIIDPNINAFVDQDDTIYIFSGLLLNLTSAHQIFSVLCHEIGHVARNHLTRIKAQISQLKPIEAAMLAACVFGAVFNPAAAIGSLAIGQGLLINQIMKYSVTEEMEADEFAIKVLYRLQYNLDGFIETFKKILQIEKAHDIKNISFKNHPDTIQRIRNAKSKTLNYKFKTKQFPNYLEEKFQRIYYKLSAFLNSKQEFYKKTLSSKKYINYGRAIIAHKEGRSEEAIKIINNKLLKIDNNDPYYLELKGQVLFETGNYAKAAMCYQKSITNLENNKLIKIELAKSLLKIALGEEQDKKSTEKLLTNLNINQTEEDIKIKLADKCIRILKSVERIDEMNIDLSSTLLGCYRLKNQKGLSFYMLGKISYMLGDMERAIQELTFAKQLFKKDGMDTILIDDLIILINNNKSLRR